MASSVLGVVPVVAVVPGFGRSKIQVVEVEREVVEQRNVARDEQ